MTRVWGAFIVSSVRSADGFTPTLLLPTTVVITGWMTLIQVRVCYLRVAITASIAAIILVLVAFYLGVATGLVFLGGNRRIFLDGLGETAGTILFTAFYLFGIKTFSGAHLLSFRNDFGSFNVDLPMCKLLRGCCQA